MKKTFKGTAVLACFLASFAAKSQTPTTFTGPVGINNTNPQSALSVGNVSSGTGEAAYKGDIQIQTAGGAVNSNGGLEFKTAVTANGGWGWRIAAPDYFNTNNPMVFQYRKDGSAWTEAMRISNTGNLGLGVTAPNAKLHLQTGGTVTYTGDGNSNDALVLGTNKTSGVQGNVAVYSYDASGIDKGGSMVLGGKYDATNNIASFAKIKAGKSETTAGDYSGYLSFYTRLTGSSLVERMRIDKNGNVAIGGTFTSGTGPYKLAVEGKIGAREIKVTLASPWADYVFADNYKLKSLYDVDQFVKVNKHLPGIPSSAEVEKAGGVELGNINVKLLEKVEELTLYVIELKKENDAIKEQLNNIKQTK